MADSATATYTFTLPEVGASEDTWGTKLNANWTALDTILSNRFDGTTAIAPNLVGWEVSGVAVTSTAAELNLLDGVTATTAELNILDGVTATAAELNALDGITATVAELNHTDGVTSNIQTQLDAKAPLASPALTGVPTAPTATVGTDTTQVATTAFVQAAQGFSFDVSSGSFAGTNLTEEFTSIPAGTQLIEIYCYGIGVGSTDDLYIHLGNASTYVTTGALYNSVSSTRIAAATAATDTDTNTFLINRSASGDRFTGVITLFRREDGSNNWGSFHNGSQGAGITVNGGGFCNVGGELTRFRFSSSSGSQQIISGYVRISYKG